MQFHPVATGNRSNGWTADKQAYFLGHLAATGSVAQAAAFVGMTARSAYKLGTRPDAASFCAAWSRAIDIACGRPPFVPHPDAELALPDRRLMWALSYHGNRAASPTRSYCTHTLALDLQAAIANLTDIPSNLEEMPSPESSRTPPQESVRKS
ncbi:hypothetical protein [Sandaracinobacteroides hominis]|uniref:hypothetical protein n=1 Tax=Sandaracinobacteroides hominis TaxID=2780086 RepID=UPI0018F7AB57|nr:hypothetical protein [Sandaracinobacteroides hominis]